MTKEFFGKLHNLIEHNDLIEFNGRITRITGMMVESTGPLVNIGDVCKIYPNVGQSYIFAEVVGFRDSSVLLMPYGSISGIGPGNRVVASDADFGVSVGEGLRGRILDALGNPIDGKPPIEVEAYYPVENEPPNPLQRTRIKQKLNLGIRAMDGLLTMGRGQRVGIFAGSGVGKSTTLGMIARCSDADINVIVLVGERGREVLDFMEKDLQEEGLAKSVVVVATSDMPSMLRLKSAMVGTSIAEFFRDKGYNVLLMMDSLTRFAMAQREIGMAVGEPPVARGFTPSVYAKLPKLLERSGTSPHGSITAIYTVLVEGDDMNEPISDTVRGILDGHVVLSRKLANSNHYPPIDILASVSRLMPEIVDHSHYEMAQQVKNMMSEINEAESLLLIGAYKPGTNPVLDKALAKKDLISKMLKQGMKEHTTHDEVIEMLKEITDYKD